MSCEAFGWVLLSSTAPSKHRWLWQTLPWVLEAGLKGWLSRFLDVLKRFGGDGVVVAQVAAGGGIDGS